MSYLIDYNTEAKIHQAEILKEAAQERAARMARGDAQKADGRGRTLALSLAGLAIGLAALAGYFHF